MLKEHQQLQSHSDGTLSRGLANQREQHDAASMRWQQQELLRLTPSFNDQQQQIGELHQALSERFGETATY